MGKTCVCGAEELEVSVSERRFTAPGGVVVTEGEVISIDGTSGVVYLGEVPVVDSSVVEYFEGAEPDEDLVKAVDRIMRHADAARRLGVRANADTPEDAARARRFGAEGIGLCRTEHMVLGEDRLPVVRRMILAGTPQERDAALQELLPLQRADFVELFREMRDLPVTVRLIDPPLHEFLPPLEDLAVKVRARMSTSRPSAPHTQVLPMPRATTAA